MYEGRIVQELEFILQYISYSEDHHAEQSLTDNSTLCPIRNE